VINLILDASTLLSVQSRPSLFSASSACILFYRHQLCLTLLHVLSSASSSSATINGSFCQLSNMSHIQQDQVISDEENELCPLCIEEFDLSDRNFHPCPCGYQVCIHHPLAGCLKFAKICPLLDMSVLL